MLLARLQQPLNSWSHQMQNLATSLPLILFIYKLLQSNSWVDRYFKAPCTKINVLFPLTFLVTLMVVHLCGFTHIAHYQQAYQDCLRMLNGNFEIFNATKLRAILVLVPGSMLTWKIFLLQRRMVQEEVPDLLDCEVFDVDGSALVSYTKQREGSDFGHSKRFRGRRLLQLSASFIGSFFVDCKLFPGQTNVATFFRKSVKRAIALGYYFEIVRADAAYGNIQNLLFLEKLSLSYVMGISTNLKALKEGKKLFTKLSRKRSSRIIHVKKGIALLDLGKVNVAPSNAKKKELRRVILCRRIHRRKKKGKKGEKARWVIKTYFHAIVTERDGTALKIYKFYMKRQCIENGFKELRYHFSLNSFCKNGKNSLKANELWIASKMLAMTITKIFGQKMLSKRLRSKRRKTLLRDLFENTVLCVQGEQVELRRNPKCLWHLRRIFTKLEQNRFLSKPFRIGA